MKELTIEEKARRYDEAIETAIKINSGEGVAAPSDWTICEVIFPELKESKEEKIRKVIYGWIYTQPSQFFDSGFSKEEMLAWLEKQGEQKSIDNLTPQEAMDIAIAKCFKEGEQKPIIEMKSAEESLGIDSDTYNKIVDECIYGDNKSTWGKQGGQKPADEVKPKFKIGDWVVSPTGVYWHIDRIENNRYEVTSDTGKCADWPLDTDLYHLWTIQDAKDGDVLAAHECLVLFKEIDGLNIKCYCTYHFMNTPSFYVNTLQNKSAFHPATKEQRDLLFLKMKEAGYEWDAEKKELNKIEKKPVDKKGMNLVEEEMTPFQKEVYCIIDTAIEEEQGLKQVCDELLSLAHDEIMQKSAWSEEDDDMDLNFT